MAKIGKSPKTKSRYLYKVGMIFCACDPLHYGHIRLFERASKLCRKVYACTESDAIIRRDKGREPFTTEKQRVKDLKGIKYLTDVFCRSDKRDRGYWAKKVKTDVLILGSDYIGKEWEGRKLGIKIIFLPRTEEISSTYIRNELPRNIS